MKIFYSSLLVVDTNANMATQLTMVPAIQLENFTRMVVAPDKWSHQGSVRWPLINVFPVKDQVLLKNCVMQFDACVTKAMDTIIAEVVGFCIFTILPTRVTRIVVQYVRSIFESQSEFRSWSHCPKHIEVPVFSYSRKSSMTFL